MNKICYQFDLSEKCKEYIDHSLELYNFSKNEYLNPIIYEIEQNKFGFYAYINDTIIGGACGCIDNEYWAYLELLFVDEKYRNNNIATNLMKKVEQFAIKNKCIGIRTETWDFQAKGFYEKLGFTVYGKLENHPPKATDYLLKKVLINNVLDFPAPIK